MTEDTKSEEKKDDVPECCQGCIKWEQFGRSCWVYWERKKHCTQKVESIDQLPVQ